MSMPAIQMLDLSSVLGLSVGPSRPAAPEPPPVTWDDICGQEKAKAAMREAIELPIKHADVYKRFGRRPSKGVLLYGPPGNGKTMLAKAAANAVAKLYGATRSGARGFISVKGPELFNCYVGETEREIRRIFAEAAAHKREAGFPALIFIDEAESILSARGSHNGCGYMDGFVQQFLTEMDGFDDSSAIVILATNRPDVLDPAIVRAGRIDRRIHVGAPTRTDAAAIIRKNLGTRPIIGALDEVVQAAVAALYDPKHVLYLVHLEDGSTKPIALHDVINGAEVANLVERATTRAIDRAINVGGPEGITGDDFVASVRALLDESRDVTHKDQIADCLQGLRWTHVSRAAKDAVTVAVSAQSPVVVVTSVGQA